MAIRYIIYPLILSSFPFYNPPQFLHYCPSQHMFPAHATNACAQIYLYSNELAERGVRKMEKKNVVFTKDGAKVGVKDVSAEQYADKTQRAFVKTWNAAHDSPQTGNTVRRQGTL